jgi:hypothetical protein
MMTVKAGMAFVAGNAKGWQSMLGMEAALAQ